MSSDALPIAAASDAVATPAGPRPKRLWQWLVMVPAALAPLYTAAPVWADKALAIRNDFVSGSFKEGKEQLRLAQRNMECLQAPYKFYSNPNRLKIDGTICPSGDVLLRAVDGLQRQGIYFVGTSTLQNQLEAAAALPAPSIPASTESWPAEAGAPAILHRAAYGGGTAAGPVGAQLYLAQGGEVRVLDTRPMPGNPRYIIQRVMRPDGCFEQVIDLANGAVVQITRVQC